MGKTLKKLTSALGLTSNTPKVSLPEPAAPDVPQNAASEDGAVVRIGADSLEERLKSSSASRKTFTSIGGSSSGISL